MARRAHRTRRLGWTVAGLLLMAPAASAQEEAPPARSLTPDERARELYLRGDRLYAEGSYDEAVVAFEKAYELSQRPALLYDMANALERLGRYEEALHRLNLYVPHAPEHQKNTLLKRMRSLEARAEEQRERESVGATPSPPASPSPGPVEAPPPPPAARPADEPAPSAPVLGYAIGGGGLASIGVGVLFGLAASSARDDAESLCVDAGSRRLCPSSVEGRLSAADHRALIADIAIGVGLAALGVGAYLVLSHDGDSGSATELRAAATEGGGRMDLVTTF